MRAWGAALPPVQPEPTIVTPAGVCERCHGSGWVVTPDATSNGSASACPCRADQPIEQRLTKAGVWARFLASSRATWRAERDPWPEESLAAFGPVRPLLTLFGVTGAGKTTLATAILREILESGHRCKWVHLPTWLGEQRELMAYDAHGESLRQRSALTTYPGLLVLDELFSRAAIGAGATDYELDAAPGLITGRDGRCLLTIVTTNLAPADILGIAPALGSRILGGLTVELLGSDARLEAMCLRAKGARR